MLERVEVMRGSGSRYGPGAMGGVVNLVSKSPDGTRAFADVSQGSFWTTTASLGGSTQVLGGEGLAVLHGLRSDGDFSYRWDDKPALEGNPWPTAVRSNNRALLGGGLLRWRRLVGSSRVDVLGEGLTESRGLAGPVQNPTTDASQVTGRGTLSARVATTFENGGELQVLGFGRIDSTALKGSVNLLQDMLRQEHERDGAHWKMEWKVMPEICLMTSIVLQNMEFALGGLLVNRGKMRTNMDILGGFMLSERVMFELSDKVGKQTAHELMYETSRRGMEGGMSFRDALFSDERVLRVLTEKELQDLLDPTTYVGHAPQLVDHALSVVRESRWLD